MKLDWLALEDAFDNGSPELSAFLDRVRVPSSRVGSRPRHVDFCGER
jgi:hypothetical protein